MGSVGMGWVKMCRVEMAIDGMGRIESWARTGVGLDWVKLAQVRSDWVRSGQVRSSAIGGMCRKERGLVTDRIGWVRQVV